MIKNIEVKNFKAIESAKVKLTPLTAFIGYNGMGKSSLLEALQMFKSIVTEGLDAAVRPWREFEHIYYKGKKKKRKFAKDGIELQFAPMEFKVAFERNNAPIISNARLGSSIGQELNSKGTLIFMEEWFKSSHYEVIRNVNNERTVTFSNSNKPSTTEIPFNAIDQSVLSNIPDLRKYVEGWQFLSLNTVNMGEPHSQKKTSGPIVLQKDGRNIAEFLHSIRDKDIEVFNGILETLQYVLPYAKDLQPQITQELEKMVYLQLSEQDFKLPGWMLSTGTLKILALLAVFRHPEPSPLIVIEELENGLDPRTIHLVITEIRNFIDNKKGQVLITSHSPYLLDQLHISQIVFVERKDEKVSLSRPADNEEVLEWSKKFAPGQLYTQKGFSN